MAANRDAMKNASLDALNGKRNRREDLLDDLSTAMMGDIKRSAGERITAAGISIYTIVPDATQPRRALPTEVRKKWDGDPTSVPALFMEWVRRTREYAPLVVAILNGEETERPEEVPAHVGALLEIADLAASIRRDGLTNPITVVAHHDGYIIETGERRWLAYHLLVAHTGEDRWTKIPARVVEQFNRWRQAAENNTRQDLNAIGKARQLAVLLMELLQHTHEFKSLDAFEHEQGFYAQVADGEMFRTPRGKGELLLNATGLKNAIQLRQYRALLRLPHDVWEQADDGNWTEYYIRTVESDDTVSVVTVSQNQQFGISHPPAPSSKKVEKRFTPLLNGDIWAQVKSFRGVTENVERYEAPQRRKIAEDAEQLAAYFADIAKRARG